MQSMKVCQLVFLFCFFVSQSAFGFINIEALRRGSGAGFRGKSSLKFFGQQGAVNKFATNVATLNAYQQASDEVLFLIDYSNAATNAVRDTNNGRAHLRYTFGVRDATAVELFGQTEFDQFRDLKLRNLLGSNLRFRMIRAESEGLFLGIGGFYENSDIKNYVRQVLARGNMYMSYTNGDDGWNSNLTAYVQPSTQNWADIRLMLQAGLEAIMTAKLSVDIQVSYRYESRPAPGISKNDLIYMSGFSLKY